MQSLSRRKPVQNAKQLSFRYIEPTEPRYN